MIAISKEEKDYISKNIPSAHIVRTMKQKSKRHRYYCEESAPVMRYLNKVRKAERSSKVESNGFTKKKR